MVSVSQRKLNGTGVGDSASAFRGPPDRTANKPTTNARAAATAAIPARILRAVSITDASITLRAFGSGLAHRKHGK
jgi:hypothetical protein